MKVFGIDLKLPDIKFVDPKEAKFVMITSVIVLIAFLFGVVPNTFQLFQISSKMSQMKAKSRTAEEKIKNLPRLRTHRKNYVEQISNLEKQFFDENQVSELISIVSEIAKETGIRILSSKQYDFKGEDLVSKNPYYKPVLFRLELEGKYHNFGKFVNSLENSKKLIRVSDMTMEKDEEKKDKLKIELSILVFQKVGQGVA